MTFNFNMPAVNRQVFVAGYFDKFKSGHMREALIQACQNISPVDLRRELAEYAPEKGLKRLMGTSIRDEDVFATPLLLRQSPGLLAYYRMLLGFSQKRFYASSTGLSRYKCLEERLVIPADLIDGLPSLCLALNERACELVLSLDEPVLQDDNKHLPLLTFGAQADGAWRNTIGISATSKVYGAIKAIVLESGVGIKEDEGSFTFYNKSSRAVTVSFSADPDVVIKESVGSGVITKVAIEIKGGRDRANVHNRAGEAEKSHQKALKASVGDCWTVIDLSLSSLDQLKVESPSTRRWIDLGAVESQNGLGWDKFKDLVKTSLGI